MVESLGGVSLPSLAFVLTVVPPFSISALDGGMDVNGCEWHECEYEQERWQTAAGQRGFS